MLNGMTAPAAVRTLTVADPGHATVAAGPWPARRFLPYDRVRRPRLVRALQHPRAAVIAIVAPAGYGKTALLCEWAERDRRPFAWVTADARDDDCRHLGAKLARALVAAQPRDGIGRVLVVDDVHELHGPAALDALATVVREAGPELTIALASRSRIALPIARLREQRRVTDIGPRELAMSRSEGATLLRMSGLDLDHEEIDLLVARTEGWPAGLSLAALALGDRGRPSRFGGEDRLVAEYLRDEVLADLSPEQFEFVLRTSVLDTLTGAVCDAVLRRTGSAGMLSELAQSSLLVVSLDRTDHRYRYHRLLAEMLRAELRRRDPELDRDLHRRASEWHRAAGDQDQAVHHAICAGDIDGAGRLVWNSVVDALGHGRRATIECWLGRFTEPDIAANPPLALAAANSALARGRGDLAAHWTAAATAAAGRSAPSDPGIALTRAALGRDGLAAMRNDAETAYALEPDESPWRSLCCLLSGTAQQLSGRREEAVRDLQQGARRAAVAAPDVHALCLTQLAVLAFAEEDWEEAAALTTRARSQVDRHGLASSATAALVFAASAVVRAHRGRVDEAQRDLRAATRLKATLIDFAPWYDIELRILLGRAAVRLSDINGARIALAEASRLMPRAPEGVALHVWLQDAWARHDAFVGPSAVLTTAELRILRFMPTHLSFREIAEHAHVSANTVKSHANAVYRKLGVSCRSEAVSRAREIGLLDVPDERSRCHVR
jgi:LuxR family transcriptional regulator, maltose regulon positive regulatory protein